MKYDAKGELALMTELWDPAIADDLEAFVMFASPWGKAGGPLENWKGPRTWQRDDLQEMTAHIREQKRRMALGMTPLVWKKATSAGRGPGKSAKIAWLADWMMTCRIGSTSIITANTEPQLKSRTFSEIGRWTTMLINAHWFESNVLTVFPAKWFRESIEKNLGIDCGYYYVQGQLWSEENPDAFAGAHNQYGLLLAMDEGSGIPNNIFSVSEGFFTDPTLYRFWEVCSNPRRNSGAFFDIFNNPAVMPAWRRRVLDSRTVEGTDQALFDSLIAQHGIDSDVVRIEVLGQFPKTGSRQFTGNDIVYAAQQRELKLDPGAALIMGLDVARFGDDLCVARFRQGRDARSIPAVKWKHADNVKSADNAAALIDRHQPDAVCIDSGMGSGVIDILRSRKYKVHEIGFGAGAKDRQWANKGTEMAAAAREWMTGGCLDADPMLFTDLTARDYAFYGKAQDQIILEPKLLFKSKVGRSPDDGDAFYLTFGVTAERRDRRGYRPGRPQPIAEGVDEEHFGLEY